METALDSEYTAQSTCEAGPLVLSASCSLHQANGYQQKDEHTDSSSTSSDIFTQDAVQSLQMLEFVDPFENLPDHLIIEVLVRLPVTNWASAACVRKRWAAFYKGGLLWQTALTKWFPEAGISKSWPGPICRGSSKQCFRALYVSKKLFNFGDSNGDVDELAGHIYLFLKEKLEVSGSPLSYGLLHGTVVDQFLAFGKAGSTAHELASQIWLAVIDNLDDTEHTFHLLMKIAEEWEVFLPYPYSESHAVQWRLFERIFTDFRDCLTQFEYYSTLACAKRKFEYIPSTWLGY
eukprot:c27144_g1_i1 orf=209-1081(-)